MNANDYMTRRMADLSARESAAGQQLNEEIQAAQVTYGRAMRSIAAERRHYEAISADPLVYLALRPRVYHTSPTCGWGPDRVQPRLLSEATERGLERCSSHACNPVATVTPLDAPPDARPATRLAMQIGAEAA